MKIFTNLEFNELQRKKMQELVPEDEVFFGDPENPGEADKEQFMGAEAAFGWCPPEWIPLSRNLRWLQLDSVGFGEYTGLNWDALSKTIACCNLRGFFAVPVAETVMAGILMLYRGLDRLILAGRDKEWIKLDLRRRICTLSGKTVLIAGYGTIGRRLQALLNPYDCRTMVFDKYASEATLRTITELEKALPLADIVAAALPETGETRRMLNRERIQTLKKGALLVNVGRGSLVDEPALVESLRSGHLMGAVLDVTAEEPLPQDHPLWECPNAILTQHSAGGTADELDRKLEFFFMNLCRYKDRKPLENIIDWKKGF